METLDDLLNDVRRQIEPEVTNLKEARDRLALVRRHAGTFYGALRTYRSGSLTVHSMNNPVTDGDGGLVLNRNYYPGLGPEGTQEEQPSDLVDELCLHLGPLIRETYPDAKVHKSKRGPKVYFHSPLPDGSDPTVDMVLALTRKEGEGIWIPNLEKDRWDASHPEKHADLFNGDAPAFRSTRRKITRLAKAWNKQYTVQGASSFEVSVWAWEFVDPGMGMAKGLWSLFDQAASRLEEGEATPDPAGVSDDLHLLVTAANMAIRLRKAATNLRAALDTDDEKEIRAAVSAVFWNYIDAPETSALASSVSTLKTGLPVAATALGVGVTATTAAASVSRAYGGEAPR
ncbi:MULTISPECIES: hypothetical protein [unclassified Rathayibacter]|uniref:hypothetical protein n=1 Tax=unclassified Rathayibacter TaxID=2609250 RepID=UPI000F4CF313|nr:MULTISPECIES: hypothetical protein [unclassified Rathayibacter]ROP44378.1 hypothetical protein EDF45_3844 [Rathayibacter sp. PhB186]ROS46954.1 hypothetical protein EDF44_3855 [Rathayibacter sp. PhB185]